MGLHSGGPRGHGKATAGLWRRRTLQSRQGLPRRSGAYRLFPSYRPTRPRDGCIYLNAIVQAVSPKTPEELAGELARAADAGLAVARRGGGTQMGLGTPPKRLALTLKTERLNRILDYSPEDLTVRVEAGLTLSALQDALAKHGQTVALEASLPDRAT